MSTEIKVTKSLLGAQHVSYPCPKCGDDLRSPLAEAGKPDTCPNCNARFIVPGAEYLRQVTEAKQAKERQRREEAEQRREEKQREREAAERRREEDLRRQKEEAESARLEEERRQAAKLKKQQETTAAIAEAKRAAELRQLAPDISDDGAFALMGGAPIPAPLVQPVHSPPPLTSNKRPSPPDQSTECSLPSGYRWANQTMICPNPNCRYSGRAITKPKGDMAMMIILLALLLPIGLLYALFFSGYRTYCPKCRTEVNLA